MKEKKYRRARDLLQGGVFRVDDAIFGIGLSPHRMAVYLVLCRYADARNRCAWPSWATIVEKTGMSRAQVALEIDALVETKMIIRESRCEKGMSNLYTLTHHSIWDIQDIE